ncbi:glycosyltransferase family 4 protein [bacterium]|nr:glycosyltransferase family 4 protein [bacterium]
MKILMLNHNMIWRSTFFRCYHFGRYLVRKGHEVTIYTIHPTHRRGIEEIELQGVRVVQFPDLLWGIGRSGWDLYDTHIRKQYLKKEKYDLVHAFDSRPAVIHPAMRLKKQGVPLVMDWADWWGRGGVIEERSNKLIKVFFSGIETWYEEHFRTQADATTVISTALLERAVKLGVPQKSICKITGGADVENFQPRDKQACRKKLGIALDAKVAGFMGFVHYDLDLALRAFARIFRKDKDARLILVGKPSPMTKTIAREEGCEKGILEYGILPYEVISDHMGAADVFLLPFADKQANIGRWPNKVGDYMAMGRPIISSSVGEMRHLFAAEDIGTLADPDADHFGQAVWQMLEDESACETKGRHARTAAELRYSWEHLTEVLETCYLQLGSDHSG